MSLVARPGLFDRVKTDGGRFSREEWLRDTFGRKIDFEHRGQAFYYSPETTQNVGLAIAGRVGRLVTVDENESPEGHLVPKKHKAWRAALILIDPTHHGDGQKVAVERLPAVGKPVAIFESLAAKINMTHEPFILEAHAVVPSERFWDFVKANKDQITSVEFEFVAPNMFGEADDYDSEMRDMQKRERAQKAKLKIESKDGLNLDTLRIRRAVDYANKGAGSIRAVTKNKNQFNSKEKAQITKIPNNDIDKTVIISLISRLFSNISKL